MVRNVTFLLFLFFLCAQSSYSQFGQQPPFTIIFEPVIANPLPGFHSFAFAKKDNRWLIIGGRTNGLHGLNSNGAFDEAYANNNVTVIDTVNWNFYQSSLDVFPMTVKDPLRSTNMQYYQQGDYLYMIGGYGKDSTLNKFVTFPVVSRIRVDSMIDAVVNNTSIVPYLKQITDTNLKVCGGELHELNGKFYLVFGHNFNGRYANPFMPIYTQVYTNSIKKFEISEVSGNLQISNYSEMTDTNNFHRRDLNVGPVIKPNGDFALMAYSGVFQKNKDFPYFEPILIDTGSATVFSYQQIMSHYTCANISLFDSTSKNMYTAFLGGMSFNDFDHSTNLAVQDTNVPFVSDISVFTIRPGNLFEEAVLPNETPGLKGSNAKFILHDAVQHYSNGVVNLNSITTKTLVGYFLGGLKAEMPNLGNTNANDTVYRVYLDPMPMGINQYVDNSAGIHLNLFPNPASKKLSITFDLDEPSIPEFTLTDLNGKVIRKISGMTFTKGHQQTSMDISDLKEGFYFLTLKSGKNITQKKVLIGS